MRNIKQSVILAALETTAGVDAAPTGAANAVLVREQTITPLEAAQADRALVRPYFGASEQLQGAAVVRCTLVVELVGSGVGGVAPAWGALLQACAFAPASGLAGVARVEYQPVTDAPKTATIYYNDSGVLHKLVGAMGTFSLEALVDGIPVLKFDLLGLDGGVSATALPAADYSDWKRPAVVGPASAIDVTLGCTYSEGEFAGGTQYASTGLTLTSGNATGLTSFVSSRRIDITAREMVGKTELALTDAQEVAMMAAVKTNATSSLGFAVGITPELRVLVFCPAVQLTNPTKAERNGVRTLALDLRLLPVAGNDEVLLATSVDNAPPAPELASIAAYQDAGNPLSYTSIPYSTPGLAPQSWTEEVNSGTEPQSQAFDLALPSGTPPVGGWPVVLYLHPRGATKYIEPGSAQDTQLKQKALTSGKAFASGWHRNPSVNFNWDGQGSIPLTDPGLIIQHLRALAPALNLNPNAILVVAVSKGNDYLACTYSGDLANPSSPTYAGRQSSIPNAGYSINAQVYYDSAKWADKFVLPASRAAFLAVNPSIPALPNAAELIATAPVSCLIPLAMVHETPYVAYPHATAFDDVHFSGNGTEARLAYEARGYGHRITAWAAEATSADKLGLAVPWWDNLRAGMTVREAAAAARARVRNAGIYYARSDLSGMRQNSDGTGAIAVDGVIGGIVDGSYGLSNRAAVAGSLGYPLGQPGGTNLKPTLRAKGTGGQYCIRFDALNDKLFVNYPNDGTPNVRGWSDVVLTTYLGATNSTTVQVGVASGETTWASKDVSLIVIQDTAITEADERLYANFAQELSGVTYPNQAL